MAEGTHVDVETGTGVEGFSPLAGTTSSALTAPPPEPMGPIESALLDRIDAAVVVADLSGAIVRWNRGAELLYGWTAEEAIGRQVRDLLAGRLSPTTAENVMARVRSGRSWEGELSVVRRDGTPVRIHLLDAPIRDGPGDVIGAISIATDVTDDRRTEDELHRTRELYRLVIENSSNLITLLDLRGGIVFASPSWEWIMGYRPEELVGMAALDLPHPDDLPVLRSALGRLLSEGEVHVPDLRLRHRDGRWIEVQGTARTLMDAEGRPEMVLSTAWDVTQQKAHERRLAARTGVTRVLAESPNLVEAAPRIVRAVCDSLGWDLGGLWRLERTEGVLRCIGQWHGPNIEAPEFIALSRDMTFEPGVGLPGRVWSTGEPAWIPDVVEDDNFPRAPVADREGLHGAFGFPIILGRDVLGVLEFFSQEIRQPDSDLLVTMAVIGSQVGQFMERKRAEEELLFQKTLLEAQSEAAVDGILVVSTSGTMVSFNRRFVEMWGIPEEVMASRSDAAALNAIREKLTDPQDFLARVAHLSDHPDERSRDELELLDGRTFDRYSAPVRTPDGVSHGRVWFFRDITDRKRDEATLRFLANASEMLAWSLDYRRTLARLARLAVPYLADWCMVYLVREDRSIERVALEHRDPSSRQLARRLQDQHEMDPAARHGVPEVLRTGQSILVPVATIDDVVADVRNSAGLAAASEGLKVRSWMCVPLTARGRTFGAISFVSGSDRRYALEDLAIAEDLARRAALAVDNVRLFQERDRIARTLQQSLLPPRLPEIPGIEVAAAYLPAGEGNEVGGDFYDVFDAGDGTWDVVIGDVCGKGADAATVMALAKYTLRAAAMSERRPSQILAALNQAVLHQVTDGRFCTVCYMRLKPGVGSGRLTVATGGHPLPIVLRASGRAEFVGSPGTLLGSFADPDLRDEVVDLASGEAIVLYTDGVTERRSHQLTFGEERLRAILEASAGFGAAAILERLLQAVREFGPDLPRDDIAVVVLRAGRPGRQSV
jgi:PAS domain S-box-containing protein